MGSALVLKKAPKSLQVNGLFMKRRYKGFVCIGRICKHCFSHQNLCNHPSCCHLTKCGKEEEIWSGKLSIVFLERDFASKQTSFSFVQQTLPGFFVFSISQSGPKLVQSWIWWGTFDSSTCNFLSQLQQFLVLDEISNQMMTRQEASTSNVFSCEVVELKVTLKKGWWKSARNPRLTKISSTAASELKLLAHCEITEMPSSKSHKAPL
jgi:hypothetical protein